MPEEYYGQWEQDRYLDQVIFKEKTGGTFIEIGCAEPIRLSNTYFFEKVRQWSGLSIDARKASIEEFRKVRTTTAVNAAIDKEVGLELFLDFNTLGGLLKYIGEFEYRMIKRYHGNVARPVNAYWVETRLLSDIVAENNITQVDLLCMDVEGAEANILRSIDFTKVTPSVALIECNTPDAEKEIASVLTPAGYSRKERIGQDVVFVHESLQL